MACGKCLREQTDKTVSYCFDITIGKNVITCGEIKYTKEKQTKAAIIAISDTKGQRNEQ